MPTTECVIQLHPATMKTPDAEYAHLSQQRVILTIQINDSPMPITDCGIQLHTAESAMMKTPDAHHRLHQAHGNLQTQDSEDRDASQQEEVSAALTISE